MRTYKWVESCPDYNGSHEHLIEDEREYCNAAGKWVKSGNFLTPQELKEKWRANK